MRIVDAYRNNPATLNGTKPAATSAAKAPKAEEAPSAGANASAGVKVSVSPEARRLAAKAGDDSARVERLRDSVAAGTFKVDAQLVAKKIVEAGG